MTEPAPPVLEIHRVFPAARDTVWAAWTRPERLTRWWVAEETPMRITTFDLRPGHACLFTMRISDEESWWSRMLYQEIGAPGRLVFDQGFADAEGALVRAPFSESWPLLARHEVGFEEVEGGTAVSLRVTPLDASPEEQATFQAGLADMEQGYGAAFDRLAGQLSTQA